MAEFEAVLDTVRIAMSARAARPDAPLRSRLAAIAGERYYFEHLIAGLVDWSSRLHPALSGYYMQQALPARNDANSISASISAAVYGALAPVDIISLNAWYAAALEAAAEIENDIALTADLLRGQVPRYRGRLVEVVR
ncbi:hypothetical protein ACIP5Y_23205 [Nocardia sp. NPDC088792]|uniref:hypothetical protein n=1 Tax=Nocardia sp. NPDC088792 TaxID=3364332 RepID=UPI003800146F